VGVHEVLTLLVMSALDLAKLARNISWLINKSFQRIGHAAKKSLVLKSKK